MTYGVKSKLYKRYLKEFDNYSDARVFCLKQGKIWTNATMQIYEIAGLQADRLLEEFPPTKPTNYKVKDTISMADVPPEFIKIRKKDIRGNYKLKVDPKKMAPKEKKPMSLYGMPIKLTTELSLWEKLMWKLTPTKTIYTSDGVVKLKQRKGHIFIVDILC